VPLTLGHVGIAFGEPAYNPIPYTFVVGGAGSGFRAIEGQGFKPDGFFALPPLAGGVNPSAGEFGCDVIVGNGMPMVAWYDSAAGTLNFAYYD
jgi:hypothetical protein